jgi:hypothetical protein
MKSEAFLQYRQNVVEPMMKSLQASDKSFFDALNLINELIAQLPEDERPEWGRKAMALLLSSSKDRL